MTPTPQDVAVCPVQRTRLLLRDRTVIPRSVYIRAYEVYCGVFGEQQAMIEGGCRGGFDVIEVVAFLYARSFPKAEWRDRINETLEGMKL